MKGFYINILEKFGYLNFGEINNICMCDFERYFKKHYSTKKSIRNNHCEFAEIDIAEIDNKMLIDFVESLFSIL